MFFIQNKIQNNTEYRIKYRIMPSGNTIESEPIGYEITTV